MLEHKDWEKFRTLTDSELRDELNKSREIKENMYTLNGKMKNGKYGQSSPSKIKLVAPQFGTQSRARKIEKRNWEQDLKTMGSNGGATDATGTAAAASTALRTSSEFQSTMSKLVQNSMANRGDYERKEEEQDDAEASQEAKRYGKFRAPTGGLQVPHSAEDRVHAAISTMKSKYEQNLHVVEKLFDEKKFMERKIQLLEQRLRRKAQREAQLELSGLAIDGQEEEEDDDFADYDDNEAGK